MKKLPCLSCAKAPLAYPARLDVDASFLLGTKGMKPTQNKPHKHWPPPERTTTGLWAKEAQVYSEYSLAKAGLAYTLPGKIMRVLGKLCLGTCSRSTIFSHGLCGVTGTQ